MCTCLPYPEPPSRLPPYSIPLGHPSAPAPSTLYYASNLDLAHFLIGLFVFLELSCRSCLYIFEINSLSVALFATIFSYSEGCLFTLLIVSFVVQKLLILIRSRLFIFAFISNIWEVGHRGSCCGLCWRVFCLCFPLGVSLFLCMVLESVLVSSFYKWLTSFPSTTC